MGICYPVGLSQDLDEWCRAEVDSAYTSEYSGINVIERILRDPGVSTDHSKDRVLWWPRNKRVGRMSRIMHQIDPISRICLIVNSGCLMKDDGNSFTINDLKKCSSLSIGHIKQRIREAKRKLRKITQNKTK